MPAVDCSKNATEALIETQSFIQEFAIANGRLPHEFGVDDSAGHQGVLERLRGAFRGQREPSLLLVYGLAGKRKQELVTWQSGQEGIDEKPHLLEH